MRRTPWLGTVCLLLLLAGCAQRGESGDDQSGSATAGSTATGTGTGHASPSGSGGPCDFGCEPVDRARFRVEVDGDGPYALGVPFPNLTYCLEPSVWLGSERTVAGLATAEWRELGRGDVLWLEGDGPGGLHEVVANRTGGPWCETDEDGAWTIDPDSPHSSVEVYVSSEQERSTTGPHNGTVAGSVPTEPARVAVEAEQVHGDCTALRRYEGTVEGEGWVVLQGMEPPLCAR